MDRLRVKSNKAARKLPDAAEVRLEASLNRSSNLDLDDGAVGGVASGIRIVREVVKAKEVVEEGHINFWKDFEAGVGPPLPPFRSLLQQPTLLPNRPQKRPINRRNKKPRRRNERKKIPSPKSFSGRLERVM